VEHAAAIDKQRRLTERKHRFRDREGFACRHEWQDSGALSSTKYDTLHGLQTVVGAGGLVTQHRGDICHRHTGVAKIPAPWDRLENYERDDPLAAVSWPASPGRGVSPTKPFRPSSPSGNRSPTRLLRNNQVQIPEDNPHDINTSRRSVQRPGKLDGTYDPITHRWVVLPCDAAHYDREAMPPGMRSKANLYRP